MLDALQCWAGSHRFHYAPADGAAAAPELPGPGEPGVPAATLLGELRRLGVDSASLILPVPGDVRGTGGKGPFGDAAVSAGEGVVLGDSNLALAPHPEAALSSPDDVALPWTLYALPEPPTVEQIPLAEAEHELAGAMRAAATALTELGVARHRPNVRSEIDELSATAQRLPWPEGMPSRALRVLQRASEVNAILQVASGDAPGGALSASATNARTRALAPLSHAVRFARCAAVNDAARLFTEAAETH